MTHIREPFKKEYGFYNVCHCMTGRFISSNVAIPLANAGRIYSQRLETAHTARIQKLYCQLQTSWRMLTPGHFTGFPSLRRYISVENRQQTNHGSSVGGIWAVSVRSEIHVQHIPVDTRRNNNVIMTSKRRHDVVLTSLWRYYCAVCARWDSSLCCIL